MREEICIWGGGERRNMYMGRGGGGRGDEGGGGGARGESGVATYFRLVWCNDSAQKISSNTAEQINNGNPEPAGHFFHVFQNGKVEHKGDKQMKDSTWVDQKWKKERKSYLKTCVFLCDNS